MNQNLNFGYESDRVCSPSILTQEATCTTQTDSNKDFPRASWEPQGTPSPPLFKRKRVGSNRASY